MVRPVSWAAFLLLLIVSLVLGAGLDEELFLNGELGVELDYNLAVPIDGSKDGLGLKQRNLLYSSHLTFKESVDSITPGQLFEIGKNAFNEMKASHNMYGLGKKFQPAVLTVLAVDNEIILASSQKGPGYIAYWWTGSRVKEELEACQRIFRQETRTDTKHHNDGKCGEVLTVHMYHEQGERPPLEQRHGRILAVEQGRDGIQNKPPCPVDRKTGQVPPGFWGCNKFVTRFNLEVIPTDTEAEPYDINTLAGGLVSKDQIKLDCPEEPRAGDATRKRRALLGF